MKEWVDGMFLLDQRVNPKYMALRVEWETIDFATKQLERVAFVRIMPTRKFLFNPRQVCKSMVERLTFIGGEPSTTPVWSACPK